MNLFMQQALDLARRAHGTQPNPRVGAVLVRGGKIVGRGFTQPAGGEHAEIVALRDAGEAARGAELYVTLEPCCHWGRTPPCVDALVTGGITTAHIAILDPNPSVNGAGAAELQAAGVETILGEGAEAAGRLIEDHAGRFLPA